MRHPGSTSLAGSELESANVAPRAHGVLRTARLLLMAVASTMLTVPVVTPKLLRMKEIIFRAK